MAIRTRIVHGPITWKWAAIAIDHARVVGIPENIGITQPRPYPLRLLVPVRRQRKVAVLDRGIFFEGSLRSKDAPRGEDRHKTKGECDAKTHVRHRSNRRNCDLRIARPLRMSENPGGYIIAE